MNSRFRDLFPELIGDLGFFDPGPLNSITDVAGVRVGHFTLSQPEGGIHTGVTAIWPREDVYHFRPRASGHVLHGAGEVTGFHQVVEWGMLETPILLTGTLNVGKVHDAVVDYLASKHPEMGRTEDVILPVVAECDDSFLNLARTRSVGVAEVRRALDEALASGEGCEVAEGSVGAGTGMIAFQYKGGIGTSSRKIQLGSPGNQRNYTVGVLLNANVGVRRQLRIAGRLMGRELHHEDLPSRGGEFVSPSERSVIVVVATDAPLTPDQLRRLSVRAGMGLARAGSFASHGSGEIILAFSTGAGAPRSTDSPFGQVEQVADVCLNPFYEATVECVEESVLNALVAGQETIGRDGNRVPALPIQELRSRLGLS